MTCESEDILAGEPLVYGTLDTSFDTDGMATASLNGNDVIYALALQSDGKIVAVGKYVNIAYNTAMARFNADGTLDESFSLDGDGLLVADIGSAADYAQGVAVDSDGKIIVCGTSGGNMYTARYTTAGILDTIRRSSHLLDEFTIRSYEQPPPNASPQPSCPCPSSLHSAFPSCLRACVPPCLFHPPASVCTAQTIQSFPC